MTRFPILVVVIAALTGPVGLAQGPSSEEVARRQFESGQAFARDGKFGEALKDFQAVVEAHPNSAAADNALLEIGRYYLDVVKDPGQALPVAEAILKKYPTSDSAPSAHVLVGRIALTRSRKRADLETALASFERVPRLFPDSEAVPRALHMAGEALRLEKRYDEALERYRRVAIDYPRDPWSANAQIGAGMALQALGDPIGALEEMQRARNAFPRAPEAAVALGRVTTLYRLYVRGKGGPAFTFRPDPIGPPKVSNIRAIVATPADALYYATESSIGLLLPPTAERPPGATRPRGLFVDVNGALVAIDGGSLRPAGGTPIALSIPRPGEQPRPFEEIEAAVATSGGDWLVMEKDERAIQRFSRAGKHLGPFATARVSRLAVDAYDEVAGIDREQKGIVVFDGDGKVVGRVAAKGTGYEMKNPVDVAFDAFGHLYVLDRGTVFVFNRQRQLVAAFTQPDKSPGSFKNAKAFAIDSIGRLYIADDDAEKILLFQ